jgi:hypothetical protein
MIPLSIPRTITAGTVTLLMVKGDKRSKVFRDRMMMLNEFSQSHGLSEVSQQRDGSCDVNP